MQPNVKVLQIFNQYLEPGGEQYSVSRIFSMLGEEYEMNQCLFTSEDWTGDRAPSVPLQAFRMIYNRASIRKIRRLQLETGSALWLLHNLFPVGSAGIYLESQRLGIPVVQYIHNFRPFSVNGYLWANGRVEPAGLHKHFLPEIRHASWQQSRVKTAWYALILKGLHAAGVYKRVNAWIAISRFMRDTFIQAGIAPEKIFLVPHSWERTVFTVPESDDDGYFLFLGRLTEMKGLPTLIRAWQLMGPQAPPLKIAGVGPMESSVRHFAEGHPKVDFLGHVQGQEKEKLLLGCRAMLAPSVWWEPLGLVTYEAYEYGKPMLAARSGGLEETVSHGETGFLHEPANAEELSEHVHLLASDPAKAREMGGRGRSWLERHTDPQIWKEQMREVFAYATR